jgi:hypothetical protein
VVKRKSRRELDILERAEKKQGVSDDESIEDILDSLEHGDAFLVGGSMFTDAENEQLENEAFKRCLERCKEVKKGL